MKQIVSSISRCKFPKEPVDKDARGSADQEEERTSCREERNRKRGQYTNLAPILHSLQTSLDSPFGHDGKTCHKVLALRLHPADVLPVSWELGHATLTNTTLVSSPHLHPCIQGRLRELFCPLLLLEGQLVV